MSVSYKNTSVSHNVFDCNKKLPNKLLSQLFVNNQPILGKAFHLYLHWLPIFLLDPNYTCQNSILCSHATLYHIIGHHSYLVYMVVKRLATVLGHGLLTCGQRQVQSAKTLYAGFEVRRLHWISNAPRTIAKRYHADKWVDPEANTTL